MNLAGKTFITYKQNEATRLQLTIFPILIKTCYSSTRQKQILMYDKLQ